MKQTEPCENCGYLEYAYGSTHSSWFEVSHISREPIVCPLCERCKSPMQIYYQSAHRRFYKCWNCGIVDVDKIFYESGSRRFADFTELERVAHGAKPRFFEMDEGVMP